MNTAILITVIAFGGMFGSIALMFIFLGADLKHKVWGAIISLLLGALLAFGVCADGLHARDLWNDGYCECGAHWELRGAAKTRSGQSIKYYACPECHAEIEI